MFDFSQVQIDKFIVHHVGNKSREEGLVLSKGGLVLSQEFIVNALKNYFLTPFKENSFHNFYHDSDLNLNELFVYAKEIFEEEDSFKNQSVNIAKHLYENSVHPQIKGGEFYMVYFKDCVVEDELCNAIGLFKSENKETYLKVYQKNENYEVECENGVNINRLDKGCIIFNTEKEFGYKVCLVDNINKNNEAQYWKNDFLKVRPRQDDFYQTNYAINLCRSFCDNVITEKNSFSKKAQVEVKSKAAEYFATKETFSKEEFIDEVINAPELIEAFEDYKESYVRENNLPPVKDEFEISDSAAKSAKKNFKSVIKLDKSFTLYVHGNPDLIDKGYDADKRMNYYTLFYREEK